MRIWKKQPLHRTCARWFFYQSAPKKPASALLVCSPEAKAFAGQSYGKHLVLRMPAQKIQRTEIVKMLVSVIVHEATHFISAHAACVQKEALSDIFLSQVNIKTLSHPLLAVEEPLVMATQMLFLESSDPETYKKNQDWFNHPMAIKLLPMVKEYVEKGQPLDTPFMERAAVLFNALP